MSFIYKCNIVGRATILYTIQTNPIKRKGEKEIMKNKGFSLVELIIVIAIMAILAAAIAPALIRYIDKSRRSDDVAAAETINTAAQAALANEEAYDEIQGNMPAAGGADVVLAEAAFDSPFTAVATMSGGGATFLSEVNSSCGGKSPKIKYKKNSVTMWGVGVNEAGKPVVWLEVATGDKKFELQPTICASYK